MLVFVSPNQSANLSLELTHTEVLVLPGLDTPTVFANNRQIIPQKLLTGTVKVCIIAEVPNHNSDLSTPFHICLSD